MLKSQGKRPASRKRGEAEKVVCFDVGGVLAHLRHSWKECLAAVGLEGIQNRVESIEAGRFEPFTEYQAGSLSTDEYLAMLSTFLGGLSKYHASSVHGAILAGPIEGLEEIIDELQARGTRTGCLSNTNALHWAVLRRSERFPAVSKLDVAVASHEHRLVKPRAEFYAAFEEAVRVGPSQIVYFEDDSDFVLAASMRGWDALQIDPENDPAGQVRAALQAKGLLS